MESCKNQVTALVRFRSPGGNLRAPVVCPEAAPKRGNCTTDLRWFQVAGLSGNVPHNS